MKTLLSLSATFLVVLLIGCVPTLNPVYQDHQVEFDPAFIGTWQQADSVELWEFSRRNSNSYWLTYLAKEGRQGRFVAHLAEVEGARFLDLFPANMKTDRAAFHDFHMLRLHTFYLVKQTEPKVVLSSIDVEWLDRHLDAHPDALDHMTYNGRKVITASTAELQKFLIAHLDRFTGDVTLQRN